MRTNIAFATAIFAIFLIVALSVIIGANGKTIKLLNDKVSTLSAQVEILQSERTSQAELNRMGAVNTAYVMSVIGVDIYSNGFYKMERTFTGTTQIAEGIKKNILNK